jgi:hypothetical protein
MQPSGPGLAQSQITIVSNFSNSKARPIECTRNDASRTPAAFTQNEIPERITFPSGHRPHDRIRRDVLPTWRRIERDPIAKR